MRSPTLVTLIADYGGLVAMQPEVPWLHTTVVI